MNKEEKGTRKPELICHHCMAHNVSEDHECPPLIKALAERYRATHNGLDPLHL